MLRRYFVAFLSLAALLGIGSGLAIPAVAAAPPPNPPAPGAPKTPCPPSRCEDVSVPLPRGVHVPSNKVRILLPAGYKTSSKRYPVIYLLNGAGTGGYTEWTTDSDVTTYSAQFPAIFVMPDGGQNATAGWFSDWVDGTYQFETYHIKVVMPWIDSHLRTLRGHDAIAGLSMGGFGALSYSARHPGLFKVTASFSGLVDNQYGTPVTGGGNMVRAWGNQLTNASVWAAHNPTQLAANLARTKLLIACGTGTPDQPRDQSGDEENYLFQQHIGFLAQLTRYGVAHTDDFYPGGTHSWPYWTADLHWAMPLIMASI